MNIIADSNIIFAHEAFEPFGTVTLLPARSITRHVLAEATMLLVRSLTRVDAALLNDTPVKFVGSTTIGTDHIDTDYLKNNRIGFASAPGSNAQSVAEYVISALARLAVKHKWKLQEKTVGIIGVGNTGGRLYRLCTALGMKCLLCDPPRQKDTHSDMLLPYEQVLAESDIITLHVPLTQELPWPTFRMADPVFFGLMKNGAVFINTSRGKVVNDVALTNARKKLGAVVLDVWDNEPAIDPRMVDCVDIATPHIAGYSYEGRVAGTHMIYDTACAFFYKQTSFSFFDALKKGPAHSIVVEKPTEDCISTAIGDAYPIMNDDALLRACVKKDKSKITGAFEELRNMYVYRREFAGITVQCRRGVPKKYLDLLRTLGFPLQICV